MNNSNICTIVAKNYISFARTLCESFLATHPSGKCFVLIIDDIVNFIDPDDENFDIISLNELNIPDIRSLSFKYDITEFSTAVKPYLMEYLLVEENVEKLLYLDPDILVTDSLEELYTKLNDTDIILTPHLDTDYPDDGLMPNDSHIMRSGIFNLGFIGVRNCNNTKNFLRWWQKKLFDKCLIDHKAGYMVDQKFIDYALVLFTGISIIYDTGYNVAYWNIHSRNIESIGDRWKCNKKNLYFFHFSDFKPDETEKISGHQTRYNLNDNKGLEDIFRHYSNKLFEHGYKKTRSWPYTYNYYNSGKQIRNSARKLFKKEESSLNVSDPFEIKYFPFTFKYRLLFREIFSYIAKVSTYISNNI